MTLPVRFNNDYLRQTGGEKILDQINESNSRTAQRAAAADSTSDAQKGPEGLERFGIRTPAQLGERVAKLGKQHYLVEGLIPQQAVVLVVGDSGLGKSPLLYQMALCVTTGEPFLGRPVRKGRVLYMDSEDGLGQVDDMVHQLSKHLGVEEPLDDLLLWNVNDLPEGYGQKGRGFEDMIKAVNPDLVIMDPLNAVYPGIERDNSTATLAYKHLRTIMSKTRCTVVGVHHTRKTDSENRRDNEPLEIADIGEWFQQARGPRVLINGSDVRLGIDKPAKSHIRGDDGEIVLRGFERVRGEIPAIRIARVMDDDGEPCGYDQLSGAKLLGNEDQQQAFGRLPERFRFKEAKRIYGKADQATTDFLNKCIAAGILRKVTKGKYEKLGPSVGPQPVSESMPKAA